MSEATPPPAGDQPAAPQGAPADSSDDVRRDRAISVVEALLLAAVTVLAAWSGYSSARWSTESRIDLAEASTARAEATRATLDAGETKDFDAETFGAWFTAFSVGNQQAMTLAEKRFRPEFEVAFDAWMATQPLTNPDAPPGPSYMPEYSQPDAAKGRALDAKADRLFAEGSVAGGHANDYVRITVYLASVLFLVGISGHFRFSLARVGLIVIGSGILVYAVVLLAAAPSAPS